MAAEQPSERQAAELVDQITAFTRRRVPKAATILEDAERRLLEAIRRDGAGDLARDGFSSGRSAGAPNEDAPRSSVENAALTNLGVYGLPPRDRLHVNLLAAWFELDQAVRHLHNFRYRLDLIDHDSDPTIARPTSASCESCGRRIEQTAADRVKAGWCSECRAAWVTFASAALLEGHHPDRGAFTRQRRAVA